MTRAVPFADMLPGPNGPILIVPGSTTADDGAFRIVRPPGPVQPGAIPLYDAIDLALGAQDGGIAAVPGTGQLWAADGDWIATYR
jgi:hypothetical protein